MNNNLITVANWSQHYAVMSDDDLDREIKLKDVRRIQLREADGTIKRDGWRLFAGHIMRLFKDEFAQYIEDRKLTEQMLVTLSKTWAVQLEAEYVAFGVDGIRAAMRQHVAEDESPYYRFPKVGQIKAMCRKLKGSPEHEKGLREQQRAEAKLEAEHQASFDAWKMKHPDEWRALEKKADKMRAMYSRQEGAV